MFRTIIFIFSFSFVFSGCIEIEEKIIVHANRTGSASYSVKTSEVGSLLYGISGMLGFSMDHVIIDEAEELVQILKIQPGIENLSYNLTHSKGMYYLRFDFTDASSFNKALYKMGGQKKTFFSPGYLKICRSSFRKLNFSPYLADYLRKEGKEINMVLNSDLLIFRSEISFPREIKRTNKTSVSLTPSQTTISQKFKVRDILEKKTDTGIRVRY